MRSIVRAPFVARKTKRVSSRSSGLPSGVTHSSRRRARPRRRRSSLERTDRWTIVPIFGACAGRDRVGVVPEVEAVHVAVVEPEADVVRMIHALARPRLERIAARHDDAVRRAQRIEHRLLERRRPDVGRERLAADEDVDAPVGLVLARPRRSSDRRSSRQSSSPPARRRWCSSSRRRRVRARGADDDG